MPKPVGNPGLKGKLVDKSVEAYILALETINCISIKYRVETFTYLLCNAWELLLKAKIIADSGNQAIYYSSGKGQPKKTLALRDCLKQVLADNDPVRVNVEHIADLRDEAVHLIISKVPKEVLALFQSSVLNYHEKLNLWFNTSISDRVSVGMMTIVFDFKPEEFDLESPRLKRELGKETVDYLTKLQADLRGDFDRFRGSAQFSIDIGYRLSLSKKISEGDIVLVAGIDKGRPVQVVEVPKDAGRTHPLRMKDVVDNVNSALGDGTVNSYAIQCVNSVFNVDKRSEFYHLNSVVGSPKQYSNEYVVWMVSEYKKDGNFFARAKENLKKANKQMKKKKN